ncbi:hypothetical protein [Rhizorhabdus argentea]
MRLIYPFDGVNTIILGNTDGDISTAEFMLTLRGPATLESSNILV